VGKRKKFEKRLYFCDCFSFKVVMDEKQITVTEDELEMLALLRRQPDLNEAVQEVLAMARHEGWDANEVEEKLIEATRKLGRATVESWAVGRASQVEEELEQVEPPLHRHKKKR